MDKSPKDIKPKLVVEHFDGTIEISSDESLDGSQHQDDTAFKTAANFTSTQGIEDASTGWTDNTNYTTPASTSFRPSYSSTSTPAIPKFDPDTTINASDLSASRNCQEVDDELTNDTQKSETTDTSIEPSSFSTVMTDTSYDNSVNYTTDTSIEPSSFSTVMTDTSYDNSVNDTTDTTIEKSFFSPIGSERPKPDSSYILSGSSFENTTLASEMSHYSNTSLDVSTDTSTVRQNGGPDNSSSSSSDDISSATESGQDEDDLEEEEQCLHHQMSLPNKHPRISDPELPQTCTVLVSNKTGGKVYLVGTAHFSKESQDDVAKVIQAVQPDAVVLELCKARINILHQDEAKIQEEAKNLTVDKMIATIRQNGAMQGTMYLFLLYFSARLTKELGMAPGGEFRRAFIEARNVPGCIVQLGDRPIDITLKRAFSSLTCWQKIKFGFSILTCKDSITAEEVEQCKQKDLLESMLGEIAGEFPALSRVFVQERDLFLANSLRVAVDSPFKFPLDPNDSSQAVKNEPPVVVGVVGIGHVAGIVQNWDSINPSDICKLMTIPKRSLAERMTYTSIRLISLGLGLFVCYKMVKVPVNFVRSKIL